MPSTKQSLARKPSHSPARGRPSARRTVPAVAVDAAQLEELLLQGLETELGGVQVYECAVRCAQDDGLRKEWQKYLEQTRHHVDVVTGICDARGIDTNGETPGRLIVRHLGEGLVSAMEQALDSGDLAAAQLVAAECVVMAETKDHQNWELLEEVVKVLQGRDAKVIQAAVDEVEDEEDEHLYHTMGWARELWLQSLGLPAVIPPPEERRHVKSAIAAAKAKKGRKTMKPRRS